MSFVWLWLASALAAPLSADEAVRLSLEQSVDVASAAAEVQSARGEARATTLFQSDPTVQGRWAAVGDVHGVSVSQRVSVTGEGLAAHRAARARVDGATAQQTRSQLEVAAATRLAWVSAVEAEQQVVLAEQGVALAARLREGAEARERTGDGSLLHARLARLQETEARSTWMAAVANEGTCMAELASWTGVAVDALELPDDPLLGIAEVQVEAVSRSDLQAARSSVDAARSRLASERAATLPPLQLGMFYEQEGDERRLGPSVGVTLPLWSRNAAGRADASAQLDLATAVAAERERVVTAEQAASLRVMEALESGTLGDPREQAQVALESVAIGFERGELDLLTAGLLRQQILQGQRAWLQGQRLQAEVRIAAALAYDSPVLLER